MDYRGGARGIKETSKGDQSGEREGGTRERVGLGVAGAGLGPKGRGLQTEATPRAAQ